MNQTGKKWLIFGIIVSFFLIPNVKGKDPDTSKLGTHGIVEYIVDGDTFDVEGLGRVRLADINTPEMSTVEGQEAKDYVYDLCYQEYVYLDIDDMYITGYYGRYIAVVYIPFNNTHLVNLNQLLLKNGYAEASDYKNEFNPDIWLNNPMEYVMNPSYIEPEPEPYLRITSPNADTVWYAGDVVTITWETNIDEDFVDIFVWSWSGHELYAYDVTNDGSFSFTLSLETPTGMDWYVYIEILGFNSDSCFSPDFTITEKPPEPEPIPDPEPDPEPDPDPAETFKIDGYDFLYLMLSMVGAVFLIIVIKTKKRGI